MPVLAAPDNPDTPRARRERVRSRRRRRRRARPAGSRGSRATGYRVFIAAEGTGSRRPHRAVLAGEGVISTASPRSPTRARARSARRAHRRRAARPRRGAAGRAARARRRSRPHRSPPRAPPAARRAHGRRLLRRPRRRRLRRAPPARRRSLPRHEAAHDVRRQRDYLVVEFKGGEVYVHTEQVGLVRKYTGGETPKLSKMGGADCEKTRAERAQRGARDRGGARRALPPAARDARPRVRGPTRRGSTRSRRRSRTRRRPTRCRRSSTIKADMERADPDGPPRVRRRRLRQDRGRGPRRVQGGARRQAGRDPRADHAAREPARPDVPRALRELPGARRGAVAVPVGEGAERRSCATSQTARSTSSIGTHRLLSDDMQFKDLGLLVVDEEQRFGVQHKERIKQMRTNVDVLTLTATPIPRTLEMSLTGIRDLSLVNTPPEDRQPILTYVGEYDDRAGVGGDPARAAARGPGVLRAQPRARHRARRRRRARARARSARRGRARADGREPARAGGARRSGSTSSTCSCARRSSRAASTCRR